MTPRRSARSTTVVRPDQHGVRGGRSRRPRRGRRRIGAAPPRATRRGPRAAHAAPARGAAAASHRAPRRRDRAPVVRVARASATTIPTATRSRSSTSSSASACRAGCSKTIREDHGLAYSDLLVVGQLQRHRRVLDLRRDDARQHAGRRAPHARASSTTSCANGSTERELEVAKSAFEGATRHEPRGHRVANGAPRHVGDHPWCGDATRSISHRGAARCHDATRQRVAATIFGGEPTVAAVGPVDAARCVGLRRAIAGGTCDAASIRVQP